jgi:hypothetical protein
MSTEAENLTLTEKADAAFRQVVIKVIERARQTGTPVIVWENGRVTARSIDDLTTMPGRVERGDEGRDVAKA